MPSSTIILVGPAGSAVKLRSLHLDD